MSDRIGIVGSPSTTGKVTVDILGDASGTPLRGQLVYTGHELDRGRHLVALGTLTELKTSNRWHEDPNMRGVLKEHGSLPHLSGVGDVRTGELLVQAAYEAENADLEGEDPIESGGSLSMSPTTGAPVSRVTNEFLTQLLRRHSDVVTFLGNIHRTDVLLPLTLRHFGDRRDGGTGEAYHTGVFGMTGSGKSGFAAYLLAALLRHPALGVLIIDPQGQFSTEEGLPIPLQEWAEEQGRNVEIFRISRDLRLRKDAVLLGDLLGSTRFFRDILTIKGSANQESAIAEFTRVLRSCDSWEERPADEVLQEVVATLWGDDRALKRIYSSAQSLARLEATLESLLADEAEFEEAARVFRPLHSLFSSENPEGGQRRSIDYALHLALDPGATRSLVLLDFSPSTTDDDDQAFAALDSTSVKARILRTVCSVINQRAERMYRERASLNTLVVFDEAHRFASQAPEDEEVATLSGRLVDYVRTTRKFGLGWMFITQEIGSLKRAIYSQLRVRCFGYGLTSGTELSRLKETIGDQASVDLYRSFVDPAAIEPSEYPFMVTGPISPLSFTGAPLFLSVFTDFERFREANE